MIFYRIIPYYFTFNHITFYLIILLSYYTIIIIIIIVVIIIIIGIIGHNIFLVCVVALKRAVLLERNEGL